MNRILLAALFVLLITGLPQLVSADCADPVRPEGTFIFNADQNVPQVCTAAGWVALGVLNPGAGGSGCTDPVGTEGQILYNSAYHTPQYCDGDDWIAMIGKVQGCTAPSDCSSVGNVCADGSLFAGFNVIGDTCYQILVTDDNQSTSIQWKTSQGTDDINPDDFVDGQANHTNRGGALSDFPAFDLCESNTYHGKSDWYLPAKAELNLLWLNRAAINANAAGNFTTSPYWSSTEYSSSIHGWCQNFGDGEQTGNCGKASNRSVRCVRHVTSPGSSGAGGGGGGGGCTAPTDCSTIGATCTDGSKFAGYAFHDGACHVLYADSTDKADDNWADVSENTAAESPFDGSLNAQDIIDNFTVSQYPAINACETSTAHGQNDWYLPAQSELITLYWNRSAIGGFGDEYWTSTQRSSGRTFYLDFGNGDLMSNNSNHTDVWSIRCVRSEPSQ